MKKWDWSLSFARMISMCFIIACHFMQYYGYELAWWFNVGVQMFFFLSGFLFANKVVDLNTLKKQFIKILVPYYLVVILANIAWILSGASNIKSIISAVVLYGYGDFVGLRHLWFVAYILIAYMLTPLIQSIIRRLEGSLYRMIIGCTFILVGIFLFFELFASYYNAAWIICYFIGLFLGRLLGSDNTQMTRGGCIVYIIAGLAVVFNGIQIVVDYVLRIEFTGIYAMVYGMFCDYAHVFLGISLVFLLRLAYRKLFSTLSESTILRFSDKYSYYIYLVHQIFILGTFSMCSLIKPVILAIMVAMIITIAAGVILGNISEQIKSRVVLKIGTDD